MTDPVQRRRRYRVPPATRDAVARALRLGLEPLKAEPPQRLADWAAQHFKFTGDSSHKTGDWDPWPFQVGWLDAFANDDIEQVDVRKAKRTGYTKCITAFFAYNAAHRRRKQGYWQPTDDDRDSYVKTEIEPAIEAMPVLRAARRQGSAEDSIKLKAFRGSVAHFLGGKAMRSYRRITLDAAVLDEIDAFDQVIEKTVDPVNGARGRLEGAPYPKLIVGTTPRLKGFSHIERQENAADARMRYRIKCPHCGCEHPLIWGDGKIAHGFKWDSSAPKPEETAHHVCPHCHGSISQADYLRVWWDGAWVCDVTGLRYGRDRTWRTHEGEPTRPPRHVAFVGLWAAYSRQRTWVDIAREAREAHAAYKAGNSGPLQTFTNESLADLWEEAYEQSDHQVLERRAKAEALPLRVVPRGAGIVLMFIDVQADRWEAVSWAFGPQGESWAIDYRVIHGNTADWQEWLTKLEPLLDTAYPTATGSRLRVSAFGVDTGYQTHLAYQFARRNKERQVHATKGDGELGKAIKARRTLVDVKVSGRLIRKGLVLWHVCTDTAKDLIHGRLQLDGAGAGRMHFAADLPSAFFTGLTAEQRVPVRTARGIEQRWVCPSGKRNEPLDCTVGCLLLAEVLDVAQWTDKQWARVLSALEPDLFDAVDAVDQLTAAASTAAAEAPAATALAADPAAVEADVAVAERPVDPVTTLKPRRPPPARPTQHVGSDEWHSRL